MTKYAKHQKNLEKFKVKLCREIPEITVFDRHVGKFLYIRIINHIKDLIKKNNIKGLVDLMINPFQYIISINITGMCDAYALYNNGSQLIHIEIECKTGKAKLSKEQKRWKNFIERNNGIHIELREDHELTIKEIKNKLGIEAGE